MTNSLCLVLVLSLPLIGLACSDAGSHPSPTVQPVAATSTPPGDAIATADPAAAPIESAISMQPAAGACQQPVRGDVVTVELLLDAVMLRCALVVPEQRIRFINHSGAPVTITLGRYSGSAGDGGSVLFDAPAGSYLALGDHIVEFGPGSKPFGCEILITEGA